VSSLVALATSSHDSEREQQRRVIFGGPMAKVDRTLQALHEIRDAVKTTNARLDAAIEVLGHRINDREIRLATEMVAVVRAVDRVRDVLRVALLR
jgi:hypothetical protein